MRAVLILLLCAVATNANPPQIYDLGTRYIPRYHQQYVNLVVRHLRNRYGLIVFPPGYYHRFGRTFPGVAVGSTTVQPFPGVAVGRTTVRSVPGVAVGRTTVRSTVLPAGRTTFRSFRGTLDGGPGPSYEDVFDSGVGPVGPGGVSVTEITQGPTRRFSLPASVYETTTRGSFGGPQVADFSTTYGDVPIPYTEGDIVGDGGIDIDGSGPGGYIDGSGPGGYIDGSGSGGYIDGSGPGGYIEGSGPVSYSGYYRSGNAVPYGPVTLAAGFNGRRGVRTEYGSSGPDVGDILRGGVDAGSSSFSAASTISSSRGRRVPSAFEKLKRDYNTYKSNQG